MDYQNIVKAGRAIDAILRDKHADKLVYREVVALQEAQSVLLDLEQTIDAALGAYDYPKD